MIDVPELERLPSSPMLCHRCGAAAAVPCACPGCSGRIVTCACPDALERYHVEQGRCPQCIAVGCTTRTWCSRHGVASPR